MSDGQLQVQQGNRERNREHPLRVLMGVPASGATGGGPALHLPMLVEDLRLQGVDVLTFPYGRWAEGESLPIKMWHQLVALLRYPAQLRKAQPDLVHLNSALDRRALLRDVPFAILTRRHGVPLLIKWHGGWSELLTERAWPWRWLVNMLLRETDVLGVLSSEEASVARRHPLLRRCEVVHNALDLGRYDRRPDLRGRLGIPGGAPLLLFISRLLPTKGLADVVRALPEVSRFGTHLVVVGNGPERRPAQALVESLGLGSVVHFMGNVSESEAADYYCGCDILVFPTYHPEGFPMVVFQSLAGGLGIVTTRIRAAADHLVEPDHCLFVPPRDSASVAMALGRLLGDTQLLERMRRNNRDLARRFERRTVAAEFASIYSEVVRDRADATRSAGRAVSEYESRSGMHRRAE